MVEGKDFEAVDIVFSILCLFVYLSTGEKRNYPITQVHTMFFELERWLRRNGKEDIMSDELLGSITGEVQKFKELLKEMFDTPCKMGQYSML